MLRTSGLTKHYGSTLALDRLSLDVPAGSVFALLGPNGSGKTTFLKLIMGFIFPDAGRIDRGGLYPGQIGYLSEQAFYPPRFAARDYMRTLGRLSGLGGAALHHEVDRLLAQLGLERAASRRLGAMSRGMLQRVGLAQALLGDPPLLLLDEPVSGLDPSAQKFMRDQILALQQAGKTIFLSSHHLDDVTRVCSHVAVLKQGRLVKTGPLPELLGSGAKVTILTGPLPDGLAEQLEAVSPGIRVSAGAVPGDGIAGGQVMLLDEARDAKGPVLRLLLDAGVDIRQLEEQRATLEEIYLKVTGDAA
jgi:ABC-2 type transport system ATP-binding protein